MKLEITEEWDGETLWNQEELVAFAPEITLAAEVECDEDCDCEEEDEEVGNCPECGHDSYSMREKGPSGKTTCAKCNETTATKSWYKTSKAENISQPEKLTVIKENDKAMIKDFSELTDEVMKQVSAAEVKALHESHANSILKMYEDKIREASEKFVAEQNAHANKLKEVEDAKAALLTKVEELSTIKAEFEKLLAEKKALATQEVFSSRMASFDLEYDLNDEERKVIAEDIKDLDDAAFAKFQDKMKVMMKEKMKANKGKKACAESVASADVLADAIDAGKKDTVTVPHTSTAEETLADKAKRAFGGDFIFVKS